MRKKRYDDEEQEVAKPKKSRAAFSKFCAFWGITFSALLYLVNLILNLLNKHLGFNPENLGKWTTGIDFVSKLALLVAVAIPAYGYVSNKRVGWKIVYILAVVFYACFSVYRLF